MAIIRVELIGWALLNAFGLLMGYTLVFGQKIRGEPPWTSGAWFAVVIVSVIPGLILMVRAFHCGRLISPETRYCLCCMSGANVFLIPIFGGARQVIWTWTRISPW